MLCCSFDLIYIFFLNFSMLLERNEISIHIVVLNIFYYCKGY